MGSKREWKVLRIKLNFRCFSMNTKSLFIVYGTLYFIQSIVFQKLRPLPIFHATNGIHASRNPCFLSRSFHRSLFWYLFKRLEMLWWQIILNGSKQMIILIHVLYTCFYGFCYMRASIVMERNQFVMTLTHIHIFPFFLYHSV